MVRISHDQALLVIPAISIPMHILFGQLLIRVVNLSSSILTVLALTPENHENEYK